MLLFLLKVHLFLLLLFCVLNSYYSVFFTFFAFSLQMTNMWKHSITYRGTDKCNFLYCYSNILAYLLVTNMPSRGYNVQILVYKSLAPLLYTKSCSLSLLFLHSCWLPYPPWGKVCFCCTEWLGNHVATLEALELPLQAFKRSSPLS